MCAFGVPLCVSMNFELEHWRFRTWIPHRDSGKTLLLLRATSVLPVYSLTYRLGIPPWLSLKFRTGHWQLAATARGQCRKSSGMVLRTWGQHPGGPSLALALILALVVPVRLA